LTKGQTVIEVNSRYFRPPEVDLLIRNPKKEKEKLVWKAKQVLTISLKMIQVDLFKVIQRGY